MLASFAVEAEIERVAPHAILTELERSDVLPPSARAVASTRGASRAAWRRRRLRSTRWATTRRDATIDLGAPQEPCSARRLVVSATLGSARPGALFCVDASG